MPEIESTGKVFTGEEVYNMFKDDPHFAVFLAFSWRDNRISCVIELALNGYTLKELSDIALYSKYVGMDDITGEMYEAEKTIIGKNWNTYSGCSIRYDHQIVSYREVMKAKGRTEALDWITKREERRNKCR